VLEIFLNYVEFRAYARMIGDKSRARGGMFLGTARIARVEKYSTMSSRSYLKKYVKAGDRDIFTFFSLFCFRCLLSS
jgi:hypothetical protein